MPKILDSIPSTTKSIILTSLLRQILAGQLKLAFTHVVAQAGLGFKSLLLLPPKCWGNRCYPPSIYFPVEVLVFSS